LFRSPARYSSGMGLYTKGTGVAKTSRSSGTTEPRGAGGPPAWASPVGGPPAPRLAAVSALNASARLRTGGASGAGFRTAQRFESRCTLPSQRTRGAIRLHFGTELVGQGADQLVKQGAPRLGDQMFQAGPQRLRIFLIAFEQAQPAQGTNARAVERDGVPAQRLLDHPGDG